MKTKILVAVVLAVLMLAGVSGVPQALADSNALNFEGYSLGNINGQDGWGKTGSYDAAVVTNSYGFASFGTQSLRISDAVTSGAFGDQTFARPLADAVGESAATDGAFSEGVRQRHFEMQFDLASTMPTVQPGMHLSVSPDRGDGSRMSYLRFEDSPAGINVFFDDVQGTTNPANFVETEIASGLSRTAPHTIKLTMDMLDGASNDIVKVYIGGSLVHVGTSWENYYRYDSEASAEQSPRIIKTVLFRESGANTPADSGKGFLIDNLTQSSSVPAQGLVFNPAISNVGVGGTTTVNIEIDAVTNLYGYQFEVNYDDTKVSASGAFVNSFLDTATNANVPPGWNHVCAAGVCKFAASRVAPALPLTGSGTVAQITFTGSAPGDVSLTFADHVLSDKDAAALTHSVSTAVIHVYGTASVSGSVSLQGRGTPIDAGSVTLTDLGGNFPPMTTNFDPGTGAFSFSNVPAMAGGSNYQIDAAHSLYLGNRQTHTLNAGDSYATGATKLLGGDANNDATISIGDLSCIGGDFGGPPSTCGGTGSSDINASGAVNILDLVLAGGNYGLSTPQGW